MIRAKFIIPLMFLLCAAGNAQAVTFIGELSTATTPAGLTGTGGFWPSDFRVRWEIEEITTGTWHYLYELTSTAHDNGIYDASDPDISHVNIEVSGSATEDNFWDFEVDGIPVNAIEVKEFDADADNNSNPGLPADFYGMKIDVGNGLRYEFYSDRAPVWGDIYVKSGNKQNAGFNSIANADFLDPDPLDAPQSGLLQDAQGQDIFKILRPDSTGTLPGPPAVPEPASSVLLIAGLGMAAFFRKRRLR